MGKALATVKSSRLTSTSGSRSLNVRAAAMAENSSARPAVEPLVPTTSKVTLMMPMLPRAPSGLAAAKLSLPSAIDLSLIIGLANGPPAPDADTYLSTSASQLREAVKLPSRHDVPLSTGMMWHPANRRQESVELNADYHRIRLLITQPGGASWKH